MPNLSATELREKMVSLFHANKTMLDGFYEYSQRLYALGVEYHTTQLTESCQTPIEELTLAAQFDARETPASLDRKLTDLSSLTVRRVIFDRPNHTFYLFV